MAENIMFAHWKPGENITFIITPKPKKKRHFIITESQSRKSYLSPVFGHSML